MSEQKYKRFKLDPIVPVQLWPGYQCMEIDGRTCIVDFMGKEKVVYYPDTGEMELHEGSLDPGDVLESNFRGALADYSEKHLPINGYTGPVPGLHGARHLYIEGVWRLTLEDLKVDPRLKAAKYSDNGLEMSLKIGDTIAECKVKFQGQKYHFGDEDFDKFLEEKMKEFATVRSA